MIGGFGRVPINWHPRAIGAFGLSSRVADSARPDAVPSGCLSKCGRFSYNIVLPDGFDTGRCQVLEIWAELSAGREETPQTELPGFPTDLSIWINDVLMGEVTLADAPSDCRGALSYIHGVSGRYGELVRVIIDDEDLVKVMQR